MCGSPIKGRPREVIIDGAKLLACESCYRRVAERVRLKAEALPGSPSEKPATKKQQPKPPLNKPNQKSAVSQKIELEVIDDYPEVIRRARERLGWTTQALANRVMESENVIKRIEQGKLRPTIELAKKLERVLGVKLLQPVSLEDEGPVVENFKGELTLGDLASIKEKKRE